MLYKEWLNQWLELYVKPTAKMQTYDKYESVSRTHIVPRFGDVPMDELTAERLQRFIVELAETRAANTVNGVITVLRKSLAAAVELGVTSRQFADKIYRPRPKEKQVECFTIVEQHKIERAVMEEETHTMCGVIICLYTGLRIGELLALEWSDFDLKKGLVTVNKSSHWASKPEGFIRFVDPPKTPQSIRVIPVPRQLLPWLRGLKRERECEYVVSCMGKPVITRTYQYMFARFLKRLNIPQKGFHSLRHTFATRSLECGMDIKTLSEILGHKNPNVTLNRYAHSLIEHKKQMMNKLGRYCKLPDPPKEPKKETKKPEKPEKE